MKVCSTLLMTVAVLPKLWLFSATVSKVLEQGGSKQNINLHMIKH